MNDDPGRAVHPPVREVPVNAGAARVRIAPWTMAQRAELRPRVSAVLTKVLELDLSGGSINIGEVLEYAEDEIAAVVRATVDLRQADLTWDQLWWEDLIVMAQAVWEVCIWRDEGKAGLGGKLASVLGDRLEQVVEQIARRFLTPEKSLRPSSGASPSSPPAGAPTPSGSAAA